MPVVRCSVCGAQNDPIETLGVCGECGKVLPKNWSVPGVEGGMSPVLEEEQKAARLARYGSYVLFGTTLLQLVGGLALLLMPRGLVPDVDTVSVSVLYLAGAGLFAGLGWFCRPCPLPAMFVGLTLCFFIGCGLLLGKGTSGFAILYAGSFYLLFQVVKEMFRV